MAACIDGGGGYGVAVGDGQDRFVGTNGSVIMGWCEVVMGHVDS